MGCDGAAGDGGEGERRLSVRWPSGGDARGGRWGAGSGWGVAGWSSSVMAGGFRMSFFDGWGRGYAVAVKEQGVPAELKAGAAVGVSGGVAGPGAARGGCRDGMNGDMGWRWGSWWKRAMLGGRPASRLGGGRAQGEEKG